MTFLLTVFSSQCFHECFFLQDQPLVIPLPCLSGTCAICEEVDFSLFPLLVPGLVLWRRPPKQRHICNHQPVNPSALPDVHSPSLHCPPIFPFPPYSTAPSHCSSSAIPCLVDLTHGLTLFVPISSIFCIKTLQLKPQ